MLHHFGKFRRPVALVMLSVFLVAQLLLPLTARAFFFGGVSLKDEKEMGHKFDVAIRSSLPMVDDPEVSKYVDGLVRRLVKAIPPQPFTFTSGVILHNAMNAFAIPGGHVYVFTGLIMNFEDESQLAGVLSHELAHVTQRHVASRLERASICPWAVCCWPSPVWPWADLQAAPWPSGLWAQASPPCSTTAVWTRTKPTRSACST